MYLGWVASIGGIIGSVIMCYSGRASNNREEDYVDEYNETATGYQPYNSPQVSRAQPIPTNRTINPNFIDKDGLYPIPASAGPGPYNPAVPEPRRTTQHNQGYTNRSYI